MLVRARTELHAADFATPADPHLARGTTVSELWIFQ